MATYPGMTLGGELRESISLDEDDLSDVEDEVFIRDGKNGYKFNEDIGVKRPLMAPRRKPNKPDFKSRLKNRPPCKALCKPCCYAFAALLVLIGLIVLVVIIVSMFPLPIDKIKNWLSSKTQESFRLKEKLLPCSDLRVTDVWTINLPKLTSESSIRNLDVNKDGVDDIIFGFGTGDNSVLHPDIFCPMFMSVASPCGGGVMALDGVSGKIIWRKHLPHTIFTLFCSADVNGDELPDCLATGKGGILSILDSKNGSIIWDFEDKNKKDLLLMDIYTANFIPDQDNDGVSDVIAAHTTQKGRDRSGQILLISGKTGEVIQIIPTPSNAEIYNIPQLLPQKHGQTLVLFGTGSPSSPGNLSIVPLKALVAGNMTSQTIYQDSFKGVLSPSILVDITGDGQLDIVTALFNSTVIAIDGSNFTQLWNVSVNNSETLSVPIPGFFNDDNVTDFLIKYQTGPDFPVYYYSQVFVIDGKTGKVVYEKPVTNSVWSQMGGLTLSMEGHGFDFFMYWSADCKNFEGNTDVFEFLPGSTLKQQSNSDICKLRFNSTKVAKLYALNQFYQPPGIEIYTSDNRTALEFNNSKTPIEEARQYLKKHPEVQIQKTAQNKLEEREEAYKEAEDSLKTVKYKDGSAFRHKDNKQGIIKDFSKNERKQNINELEQQNYDADTDYDQPSDTWQPNLSQNIQNGEPDEIDYTSYDDADPVNIYSPNKQLLGNDESKPNNRDPRSRAEKPSVKKHSADQNGAFYSPENVRNARSRLLNDLNDDPIDILKDTYFKNREMQLKKSKFEQRDLKSHIDKMKENEEVQKVLNAERQKILNVSENLWEIETESEMEEKENGYWRGKREVDKFIKGIPRISSIGTLVKSWNLKTNSIDLVFLTYWTPPIVGPELLLQKDYDCISNKIKTALNSKEEILNYEKSSLEELFKKQCLEDRGIRSNTRRSEMLKDGTKPTFPYFKQIAQLNIGQMTVYRVRIECVCEVIKKGERCAKFLDPTIDNGWSSFMGRIGDGIFRRN